MLDRSGVSVCVSSTLYGRCGTPSDAGLADTPSAAAQPNPRNTAMAPFRRCMSAGLSRPITWPTRWRLTVVSLSTWMNEGRTSGSMGEGSTCSRTAGESLVVAVSGHTVTLRRFENRSDWTITAGRGLPVKSPARSATAMTSPLVIFVEDAHPLDPVHRSIFVVSRINGLALAADLLREARRRRVRHPDLHRAKPLAAKVLAISGGAGAGRGAAGHASHVTLSRRGVKRNAWWALEDTIATACPPGKSLAVPTLRLRP